jgi:hypothetical protein
MTDGAMQYRYRGYAPGRGMFDRRDPLGYAANQFGNLYAYAQMNPVDFVDPMGLDSTQSHRGANWDANLQGAIGCLQSLCDNLPTASQVGKCPNPPETQEQCKNEAARMAQAYADALDMLRLGSYCGRQGLTRWRGNWCSFLNEDFAGIGCGSVASSIDGAITHPEGSGFSHSKKHYGIHQFVIFSHSGSVKKCVTTAWETGTPSMEYATDYRYTWLFY